MEALNFSKYPHHCRSRQLLARPRGSTKTPAASQICEQIPPSIRCTATYSGDHDMNRRRALLCTFTFVFIVSGTISQAPLLGGQRQEPERSEVNLAIYAKPSTSFVSGHETLKAIHDGSTPSRSDDYRYGAYGNWPRRGRQWVQYDWPQPISTSEAEVYWWDDHRGVRMPTAYRLLYWHDGNFVPVESATEFKVESHQFNSMRFKEITTTKLRLEFDSQQEYSTGILEWRVIDSGKSPKFPPIVDAGRDRFVMVGGRSYLEGQVDPRPRSRKLEAFGGQRSPAPARSHSMMRRD
jgi:hypothetical protein